MSLKWWDTQQISGFALKFLWFASTCVAFPLIGLLKLLGLIPDLFTWTGWLMMYVVTFGSFVGPTLMWWRGALVVWIPPAIIAAVSVMISLHSLIVPEVGTIFSLIWLMPLLLSLLYLDPRLTLFAWVSTGLFSGLAVNNGLVAEGLDGLGLSQRLIIHEVVVAVVAGAVLLLAFQLRRMHMLALVAQERDREANTDGLTGCHNYRFMTRAFQQLQEQGDSFGVLMLDIDHFKRINDSYGHLVGDQVLRHLVEVVSGRLRPGQSLCRYGGEEFVVILPGLNEEAGAFVAERIRAVVAETPLPLADEPGHLRYTVSIGVAEHRPGLANDPVREADLAMYLSKRAGKNRVTRYSSYPRGDAASSNRGGA